MNTNNEAVAEQLIALITQGNAHVTFDKAVENVPFSLMGEKPANVPYSLWQLVEHVRIAQSDILEFSRNPGHVSPKWPDAYWPVETAPKEEKNWEQSLQAINSERTEFVKLLTATDADLYTPFAHGDGQNLLREALLLADHNSYHTGEIVLIRRLVNDWKK